MKDLRTILDAFTTSGDSAAAEAAVSLLTDEATLPSGLAGPLSDFVERPTPERLRHVQLATLRAGLWQVGADLLVSVTAALVRDRHLDLEEGARLLATVPHEERHDLGVEALDAVEAADAVVEDAKDGVMAIEDDDLFRRALERVRSTLA